MISFPADVVIEALFLGVLGRLPDVEGRDFYLTSLEERKLDLRGVVELLLRNPESQFQSFGAEEALRALYLAALGRLPDEAGAATYLEWFKRDASAKTLESIATVLHSSSELQDRLLPKEFADRALVDHSPNGEFMAIIRQLIGDSNGPGLMVELGLPFPNSSFSIDFLKLSGWRGVLIESLTELHPAIQSRFSGLNFELVEANVLERGVNAIKKKTPALQNVANFGYSDRPVTVSLASVLAATNVPNDFEILAVSGALNTADVINDLIGASEYRPALMVAELRPPRNWNEFAQVGLDPTVERAYRTVFSTEQSLLLARQ